MTEYGDEQVREQFLEMVAMCTCPESLAWLGGVIYDAAERYPRAVNPSAAALKLAWDETDWLDIEGIPDKEAQWTFWRDYEVEVSA
jgi:hypothetical protein